jgi:hypothetical protein
MMKPLRIVKRGGVLVTALGLTYNFRLDKKSLLKLKTPLDVLMTYALVTNIRGLLQL